MNKKEKIIIVSLITILFITFLIILFHNPIKLNKGNITIEYNEKYKEPGFEAKKLGKNLKNKVKVTNNINYKKLGTYKVTYKLKYNNINYKKERKITIKDTKKPTIILTGKKETDVCPETKYKEEGYKAYDNYDKDITKKVKVTEEKSKITYKVKDSSNNKKTIIRKLTYKDITKPEIKINTEETINIIEGTKYEEKTTAIDNCDGDITKNIKIEGKVDTNKIGTYKLKYILKDKAGNEETKEKTINVIRKPTLNSGIPGTIYLTFDDGPKDGTTNVILDILKEENVKATFFVTNNGPDNLIKREHDEGHTVALHTATHNYAVVYASDASYFEDLTNVQNRVKRITGETSMIIRFPGGSSNTISRKYSPGIMSRLAKSTIEKGFKYYDWNISSGDAGGTTQAQGVYNNVVSNLKKDRANMILMHDIKPYTRDALRQIIKFGKENGYTFEKITMDTPMITQNVNN